MGFAAMIGDGFCSTETAARGLLRHRADAVRRLSRLDGELAGAAQLRALPARQRAQRRQCDAAGRRCRRRFLDHDLRRAPAGGRDRGGRGRRPRAGRHGRPDHEHAASSCRLAKAAIGDGLRVHPGVAARSTSPIPKPISRSMSGRGGGGRRTSASSSTTRSGQRRNLASHGRAAGRDPQCRRAEMGNAAHRCHGVRGRHLALLRAASPSSTTICSFAFSPCRRSAPAPSRFICATTGRNGASS